MRHVLLLQLNSRQIDVGSLQPEKVHWQSHEVRASSHLLEYIPGRDQLWAPETLAAGALPLSLHHAESADWCKLTCKNACCCLIFVVGAAACRILCPPMCCLLQCICSKLANSHLDWTIWPSGLRRQLQVLVRKGVGSNPTVVTHQPVKMPDILFVCIF